VPPQADTTFLKISHADMTGVIRGRAAEPDAPGVMSDRVRISEGHGPFARFRRDHRRVLAQLDALEQGAADRDRRAPLDAPLREMLDHLARQFATHMTAEDTVLYPALAEAFPESRATLAPLRREHRELRLMLASLADAFALAPGPARDEQLQVQSWDFVQLLRIHVLKEEHSVFDLAERVLRPHEVRDLVERLETCFPRQIRGVRAGRRKGSS
jgi:hemerythrin-like domain-containing protein